MKKTLLAAAAFMVASIPAWATWEPETESTIQLGTPTYGGTGCPQGTASVSLSPDASAISILFDQYQVEAGGATGKRLDRKSCNLAIPVHVPSGMSISLIQMDYRGFNSLPAGGQAVFTSEYFFAGGHGPVQSQTFRGELNDDFLISESVPLSAQIWSPCGEDVILRSNASLRVQTNSRGQQALASIDSQDIRGTNDNALMYFVEARRCN